MVDRGIYRKENERDWIDYREGGGWNRQRSAAAEAWRRPGPFTGMGPGGYERSDARLHDLICERLTQHGQVDARQMTVEVTGGEVTLAGTVHSRFEKRMAEQLVDAVWGVKDVHNRLRVAQAGQDRAQAAQNSSFQGGRLREGMNVGDREGAFLGTVKAVEAHEFLLDRPMARDVWVPLNRCEVFGGQVVLDVPAADLDQQGWRISDIG